jgi:hypothetical protein
MKKLYNKPNKENFRFKLKPKPETINFLLNFSKSIEIKKYNSIEFETNLN